MTRINRTIKILLISATTIVAAMHFLLSECASAYSSGPPTLRTGAPGEVTCAICHNSFSLNSGPGTVSITGLPPNYSQNQEVLLTLTITQPNRELFGFELTALDDSGRQAGTIVVTDDLNTQLAVDQVDGRLRQYLSHTLPGTAPIIVDQGKWSFKWRAPAANIGKVTFYIAGNAANGNGGSSGDYIYTSSASILPQVVVASGYEADVSPRPNGSDNGTVTVADWVQVGRFAGGLDVVTAGGEFQRADCAPSATLGDGSITISDWVQTGRYAAGLDKVVRAGGPAGHGQITLSPWPRGNLMSIPVETDVEARPLRLRLERSTIVNWPPLRMLDYVAELEAQGGENALGFSVQFDPAQVRFLRAVPGNRLTGAVLNLNASQASKGRIGFAVALPAGKEIASGVYQPVVLTFVTASGQSENSGLLSLGDEPIVREIVDVNANPISTPIGIERLVWPFNGLRARH